MGRGTRVIVALIAQALLVVGCAAIPGGSTPPAALTSEPTAAPTASPTATPVAEPSREALPPPTGHIAYVHGDIDETKADVYLVGADGSGLRQLTTDELFEQDLAWLLDGSRLLFVSKADPYNAHVASILPDGTDRRELGSVKTTFDPQRSPDGRRIAFGGDGAPGEQGILVVDLDDGSLVELTRDGEIDPKWSPDGSRLLAVLPSRGVLVVDAATGKRLTVIEDAGVQATVGWTADGVSILYKSCLDSMTKPECMANPIAIANADGTHIRAFKGTVPDEPDGVNEIPSPDGRWVAFSRDRVVYVRGTTGSLEIELAAGVWPAWSPDSAWVVFSQAASADVAGGPLGPVRVVIAPRTGGPAITLTQGPYDTGPIWQPR